MAALCQVGSFPGTPEFPCHPAADGRLSTCDAHLGSGELSLQQRLQLHGILVPGFDRFEDREIYGCRMMGTEAGL